MDWGIGTIFEVAQPEHSFGNLDHHCFRPNSCIAPNWNMKFVPRFAPAREREDKSNEVQCTRLTGMLNHIDSMLGLNRPRK